MTKMLIILSGVLVAVSLFSSVSAKCYHNGIDVDVSWKNKGNREINITLRSEDARKKNSNYPTHVLPYFPGYKNIFGHVEWEKDVPVITLHGHGEAILHVPRCGWTYWFREGDKDEGKGYWHGKNGGEIEIFSDENPPRAKYTQR